MAKPGPSSKYDPRDIFSTAMRFHATCNFLYRADPAKENAVAAAVGIPLLSLSALSIELFFKTLHAIEGKVVPKSHNLAALFRNLDRKTRHEIEAGWEPIRAFRTASWEQMRMMASEPKSAIPDTLDGALQQASDAFERFRYAFESASGKALPNYFIDDLRGVLIAVILKREPAWRGWTPAYSEVPPNAKR